MAQAAVDAAYRKPCPPNEPRGVGEALLRPPFGALREVKQALAPSPLLLFPLSKVLQLHHVAAESLPPV